MCERFCDVEMMILKTFSMVSLAVTSGASLHMIACVVYVTFLNSSRLNRLSHHGQSLELESSKWKTRSSPESL